MSRKIIKLALLAIFGATVALPGSLVLGKKDDAAYLWLEEVEGKKALKWVKKHNDSTLEILHKSAGYTEFKQEALKILEAKDKLPYGSISGDYVYNFWQDADHIKGLWRRANWQSYSSGNPVWEVLLDVDALATQDGKSYVFESGDCLRPLYERCMVRLSIGGSDSSLYREFDITSKTFIKNGFTLPPSKSSVTWLDENHLLVGDALSPNSQTSAGYPLMVKLWERDTPFEKAPVVFKGKKTDVAASAIVVYDGKTQHIFMSRAKTFYTSEFHYYNKGELKLLKVPENWDFKAMFKGDALFINRELYKEIKPGSVIAVDFAKLLQGELAAQSIFTPSDKQAINATARSGNHFFIGMLENVQGKVVRLSKVQKGQNWVWESTTANLPSKGNIGLDSFDDESERALLSYQDFLVPTSILKFDGETLQQNTIMQIPNRFNSAGLVIGQEFATSKDGTQIPYFIVHKSDMVFDSSNPTLLYGYGGFEIPMIPTYSAVTGKFWLEKGGVYVLANIRGGGEFGPEWHSAAIKENRQKSFDDFIAIAEDLIKKKVTSPEHLGIKGGSNGGLLMGAVFTERPELFRGVICEVPLLDMLRYHKLLAGASWMAEYGNPDDPKMAKILKAYSPFHNIKKETTYPEIFFVTSTKDDRVHPGHARKMAARLEDMKKPFLYYENVEGGHSAAANLQQTAERVALEFAYLTKKLGR